MGIPVGIISIALLLIGAVVVAEDGLYSAAQAARGESTYQENCVSCHGINLGGSEGGPAVAGEDFNAKWEGKKIFELFDLVKTTMPLSAPGSLTDRQSADLVAFILAKNKLPAGAVDLPTQTEALSRLLYKAPHR